MRLSKIEHLMLARRLFPFECVLDRVFDAADGILNLALKLIGLAFRLQLGITDGLSNRLFYGALDLLRRSGDPILVHDVMLQNPKHVS